MINKGWCLLLAALLWGCGFGEQTQAGAPLSAACAQGMLSQQAKACATIDWMTSPSVETANQGRISFWTIQGGAIAAEDIQVYPWMKIHGHGSGNVSPIVTVESGNSVLVDEVYFIMTGPWELNIQGRFAGETDHFEYPVNVEK